MKFIIVGLGNFGSSLAEKLTQQGNEVIGIDARMEKIVAYKERITHTICMDATDEETVSDLPLQNTDIVMVCIGENQGVNVMCSALFKNLGVKRLISRSINSLHENVLRAIGVDEIVRPEQESAERWAKKFYMKGTVDSFELNKDHSVVEVKTPAKLVGKTVKDVNFAKNYNVLLLTTIKQRQGNFLSKNAIVTEVLGIPKLDTVLECDDLLVLYGNNKDLVKFVNKE